MVPFGSGTQFFFTKVKLSCFIIRNLTHLKNLLLDEVVISFVNTVVTKMYRF